jgi:hypothetical protein
MVKVPPRSQATICARLSDRKITRCWLFRTHRFNVGMVQTHRSLRAIKQNADPVSSGPVPFNADGADRRPVSRYMGASELTEANPVAGLELVRLPASQLISELQVFLDGSGGPLHDGWIAAAGRNNGYFPISRRPRVPGLLDRNGIDSFAAFAFPDLGKNESDQFALR